MPAAERCSRPRRRSSTPRRPHLARPLRAPAPAHPRELSGLPGLPIPRRFGRWVARDDVVRYLEMYAAHHRLDLRLGVGVDRLDREGSRWRVHLADGTVLSAAHVVVATGYNNTPVDHILRARRSAGRRRAPASSSGICRRPWSTGSLPSSRRSRPRTCPRRGWPVPTPGCMHRPSVGASPSRTSASSTPSAPARWRSSQRSPAWRARGCYESDWCGLSVSLE